MPIYFYFSEIVYSRKRREKKINNNNYNKPLNKTKVCATKINIKRNSRGDDTHTHTHVLHAHHHVRVSRITLTKAENLDFWAVRPRSRPIIYLRDVRRDFYFHFLRLPVAATAWRAIKSRAHLSPGRVWRRSSDILNAVPFASSSRLRCRANSRTNRICKM